ncbi:MAG TPA: uridine kinase, partial [Parachlamydiaceae bacterium]|nr:uridine kinase [Parachlamydiaceae bacterium]
MLKLILSFVFLSSNVLLAGTPLIIGISGGTGSGKTTLAKKIKTSLVPNVVLIEQDCYYKDLSHLPQDERAKTNFDHPGSIDFECLRQDIQTLKKGFPIQKPIYSFSTHTRTHGTTEIASADIIIVEGILIFSEERMRDLFDLKIYVQTDDDVRILRRIQRDIHERGRDFESVYEQYISTVKPMHNQFVEPSKQYADVIIPGAADTSAAVNLILDGLRSNNV